MRRRFFALILPLMTVCFILALFENSNLSERKPARNINFDAPTEINRTTETLIAEARFTRSTSQMNFRAVDFDPWDVAEAAKNLSPRETKPYTIMIYMNGSDLESEHGAATDDLIEILESGLNSELANVVIFTGGTKDWHNDVVPDYDCVLWEVADGSIQELSRVGLRNMGNAGTLSSFIDFSMLNFPASKYGLILWDHGGGAISGYGHDEHFGNDNMTLLDLNYALKQSEASRTKLEFLGFDTCLLGTVEMAVIAADFAKYLIASEDLIPGDGWDYAFLEVLNDNPHINGAELGKAITDYFMDFYGPNYFDELNMSVIDLAYANHVMCAMGTLMEKGLGSLEAYEGEAFKSLARRRADTKTFGIGSPRDNESDMVDIGHMAYRLSDLYPAESEELLSVLGRAVIYNRNNSDIYLGGMSTFYIYGGKRNAFTSLKTYRALNMDMDYTRFLHGFSDALLGSSTRRRSSKASGESTVLDCDDIVRQDLTLWQLLPEEPYYIMVGVGEEGQGTDDLWPFIEGWHICMYKVSESERGCLYAIAAQVNEIDCDIIVLINDEFSEGKILGTRNDNGLITQKGYTPIEIGDKISFYYQSKDESIWYKAAVFEVENELQLNWEKLAKGGLFKSIRSVCLWHNYHFTAFEQVL